MAIRAMSRAGGSISQWLGWSVATNSLAQFAIAAFAIFAAIKYTLILPDWSQSLAGEAVFMALSLALVIAGAPVRDVTSFLAPRFWRAGLCMGHCRLLRYRFGGDFSFTGFFPLAGYRFIGQAICTRWNGQAFENQITREVGFDIPVR